MNINELITKLTNIRDEVGPDCKVDIRVADSRSKDWLILQISGFGTAKDEKIASILSEGH